MVPILLIAQLYLATRLKSVSCLLLITVLGYAWGIWLGLSFNMPLTAVAGLIFAVGIAQHRLGKSMIDSKTFGASTHSWVGILSALMAAHYLQVSWLSPEMNSEIPAWIPTQIWWGAFSRRSTRSICKLAHPLQTFLYYLTRHIYLKSISSRFTFGLYKTWSY